MNTIITVSGTAVELEGSQNYADFRASFMREISHKRFSDLYFQEPIAIEPPSWALFAYAPAKANGPRAWLQQYTDREIQMAELHKRTHAYVQQQQLVSDAMRFLISRLSVDVFAALHNWNPPHSPKILWDLLFTRYGPRPDEQAEATTSTEEENAAFIVIRKNSTCGYGGVDKFWDCRESMNESE